MIFDPVGHWVQIVQSLVVKAAMFVYVPLAKMSFTYMYTLR